MAAVLRPSTARTAVVMCGFLGALAYGLAATSTTADWSPWWLVALLLLVCTAAETLGSVGVPALQRLEVSSASLAVFCAFVLLGPAPGAVIGATAVAVEGVWRRKPASIVVGNVVNSASFALVGGLLAGHAFRHPHLSLSQVGLGIGLYVLCNAISFAFAAGTQALHGMRRTREFLAQYAASIPLDVAAGMLAVLAVWTYETGGGTALLLLGAALLLVQFLLSRLTRVEFALRAERDKTRAYLDSAGSPFVILDGERRIELLNRRAEALLGPSERLHGAAWSELLLVEDRAAFDMALAAAGAEPVRLESRLQGRDGIEYVVLWSVARIESTPRVPQFLLSGEDITERRVAEHELQRLALHDALTGLPNRAAFAHVADGRLDAARAAAHGLAIVFVDLDGFKAVNDAFGHAAGDALLCHAARRLERGVREHDVVARLSGDEFLVLLDELPADPVYARAIAHEVVARMLDELDAPYAIDGRELRITGSYGVAVFPEHGEDTEALLAVADREMYGRKTARRAAAAV